MTIKAIVIQIIILFVGFGGGLVSQPYIFPVQAPIAAIIEPPIIAQSSAVEELAKDELKKRKVQHANANHQRKDKFVVGRHNQVWRFGE